MPKRSDPFANLNIQSPCSAKWEEMIGTDQVRFCEHCSLHVHDFSKIARKDVISLVSRSKGKLCVRYERGPSHVRLAQSELQPLTQIKRRVSRIAAGAFGATLAITVNAAAQSCPVSTGEGVAVAENAITKELQSPTRFDGPSGSLGGTVVDPNDAVIPESTVVLINRRTGGEQRTTSDDKGDYLFDYLEPGVYKLSISSPGFEVFERAYVFVESGIARRVNATLDVGSIGGAVVILPETELIQAMWAEDSEVLSEVARVLATGADVNAVDSSTNSTALGEAVAKGSLPLVDMVLAAGADPNKRNGIGQTALMRLDEDTPVEIFSELIAAGAQVNLEDEDGNTALLAAAAIEKSELLAEVLKAGAKVDQSNNEGKTALMVAAEEGHLENVKALLLAGADVNLRDKDEKTALGYALDDEDENLVNTLLAYGAIE